MKTLISAVEFILQNTTDTLDSGYNSTELLLRRYANFLKQPLHISMFIPATLEGNVLEFDYPQNKAFDEIAQEAFKNEYQQAKERVLFEGFEIKTHPTIDTFKYIGFEYYEEPIFIVKSNTEIIQPTHGTYITVESLVKYNLTLTDNALKQILCS